jgi:hypothetical protein
MRTASAANRNAAASAKYSPNERSDIRLRMEPPRLSSDTNCAGMAFFNEGLSVAHATELVQGERTGQDTEWSRDEDLPQYTKQLDANCCTLLEDDTFGKGVWNMSSDRKTPFLRGPLHPKGRYLRGAGPRQQKNVTCPSA